MEEQDRFAQYNKPDSGQEIVYEQPGPLDAALGPLKQNAKKIIIAIIAIAIIYAALDFFVLSNKAFTIEISDTEGTEIPINSLNIYGGDNSGPLFSGKNQAIYSASIKPGNYRIEARSSGYKTYNKNTEFSAEDPAVAIKLEKNIDIEINSLELPAELYAGQQTEGSITLANNGKETVEAQLVFEGKLFEEFGSKDVYSEPGTITIAPTQAVTATIKMNVPGGIEIDNEKTGDKRTATVRVKYLNEKAEQAVTLYPKPQFSITPKSFTATINADGQNHPVKDITIKNLGQFPANSISLTIDADEESIKNWFYFEPYSTIDSLGAKSTAQSSQAIKLMANIPIGTEAQTVTPNIAITASGAALPPVTMVITVKAVKLDFIASASKETISIPKEGGAYKELIGETIRLQNKGIVDIQNIDLSTDVACRDNWISFPQGTHVDIVKKSTTETVSMRITAPATAEANKSVTCQITIMYENPLEPTQREQQVVSLFLVPQD